MKRKLFQVYALCVALGAMTVSGQSVSEPAKDTAASTEDAAIVSTETAQETHRLSESLIYSVDRTPARPFETPRAVEVITIEEIWRSNGMTFADVLTQVPGFFMQQTNFSGGAPIIRGLMGKQVLIMIDGVKLNTATWRAAAKEYLDIIDLAQVERIEIVRGVVSVLGTESLGGVINIITRKGPLDSQSFGGTVSAQYASASQSFRLPVQAYGQGKGYRFFVGASFHSAGDLQGGGSLGTQPLSDYTEGGAHGTLQLLLSADRTLSFRYQKFEQYDVSRPDSVADGTNTSFRDSPITLQLGSVSYQDLSSHPWSDSFSATAYWNRQQDGRDEVRTKTKSVNNVLLDVDTAIGGSLELGKFIGSHHLVYGVDYSHDNISSTRRDFKVSDGSPLPLAAGVRGRYTDGATYDTLGLYLSDRFSITRWVTTTAGVRYGSFSSAGEELSPYGVISVDTKNSDFTGALNVIVHATPQLNLIASSIRGFRAPNLDDISKYSERKEGIEIPNREVEPEHVDSLELGFKYERDGFGATGFWYRNELKDLLVRANGTFLGVTYFDSNGNGVQDSGELPFLQSKNIGAAQIKGLELGVHYSPIQSVTLYGNYNRTIGDDETGNEPLQRIPPAFGMAGVRWSPVAARRPWVELTYQFAAAQTRLSKADVADVRVGPGGTPAFDVFNLRGGLDVTPRVRVTGGVENLTDEAYKYHASFAYRPGRQFVLGTQFKF